MEALVWETAEELDMKLAQRVRNIRRRRKISQEELSRMSGVSYGSVKRFEATGKISLLSLTKLAMALDMADELRELFTQVPYRNIQRLLMKEDGTLQVLYDGKVVGNLALMAGRKIAFEYSEEWLETGFSISPFSLPLKEQVFIPTKEYFGGLFGVFGDSLPMGGVIYY